VGSGSVWDAETRAADARRAERAPRLRWRARAPSADALAKKQLRQAARARRRAERAELRRFTRRARERKVVLLSAVGLVTALFSLIAVAVFSPILSLRTVVVDGTNRIDPAEIRAAVEIYTGTPLALLDFDAITEELSVFPLIRSYVTEIVPPDTLLVHVVEREPIGAVQVDGVFRLVDPAGITIQESAENIEGVPVISVGGADTSSPAFAAVTEVLLSLPAAVGGQVVSATATTKDDVSLVLSGVGQRVVWGSASDSARKAALLARLISITDAGRAGEFDVSAPSNGIFRPS
jgi:cell division protein FtsQ